MKTIIKIIITFLILALVYFVAISYANKVEKIDNGEIVQVSESYRDR